jgi:hypothetical protein
MHYRIEGGIGRLVLLLFSCCSPAVRGQGGDKPPAVRGRAPCYAGTSAALER